MSQNYERLKQIIDEMNTAIAGMCTPPINLAGKENPSKKAKTNKNGLKEKKVKEIVESIINEVSVGKWVRAAKASIPKREQDVKIANKVLDVAKNNTSDVSNFSKTGKKLTKKQIKDLDNNIDVEAYQHAQKVENDAQNSLKKANDKLQHAKDVDYLKLPEKSKVSAKRFFQANRNSSTERSENNKKIGPAGRTYKDNLERVTKSINIRRADPTHLAYLKKQKVAHNAAENSLARMKNRDKVKKDKEEILKKIKHEVSGDLYNKDQYTDKAASLEKNYNKLETQKQAGTDHSNAQINQGLRNKLEKVYKMNDNNSLSEETWNSIINITESILTEKWGNNSGRYASGTFGVNDDSGDRTYVGNSERNASFKDREMSPDEYITACSRMMKGNNRCRKKYVKKVEGHRAENRGKIESLKSKIADPDNQVDIPYIDYQMGRQEGLHRAVAAKELGMKKIPVRVFHSNDKGANKRFKRTKVIESIEENNKMEEFIANLLESGISEATINSILDIVDEKVDMKDPGLMVDAVNKYKKDQAAARQKAVMDRAFKTLYPKGVKAAEKKLSCINCSDNTIEDIMSMVEAVLSEKVDKHTHLDDHLTGVILRNIPIGELGKTDKLQKAGKIEANELTQAAEREGRNRGEVYLRRHDVKSQSGPENAKRNSALFNQFSAENHAILKRREKNKK